MVVNIFVDNIFKYQIILSDKTVSPTTFSLYFFNSLTDSQHNNTEFKGLLIDSGASTQSTGGIG